MFDNSFEGNCLLLRDIFENYFDVGGFLLENDLYNFEKLVKQLWFLHGFKGFQDCLSFLSNVVLYNFFQIYRIAEEVRRIILCFQTLKFDKLGKFRIFYWKRSILMKFKILLDSLLGLMGGRLFCYLNDLFWKYEHMHSLDNLFDFWRLKCLSNRRNYFSHPLSNSL